MNDHLKCDRCGARLDYEGAIYSRRSLSHYCADIDACRARPAVTDARTWSELIEARGERADLRGGERMARKKNPKRTTKDGKLTTRDAILRVLGKADGPVETAQVVEGVLKAQGFEATPTKVRTVQWTLTSEKRTKGAEAAWERTDDGWTATTAPTVEVAPDPRDKAPAKKRRGGGGRKKAEPTPAAA